MTDKHYIEAPILLSENQVADLVELDAKPITTASQALLQTLFDLNNQITSQLANYCVQHKKGTVVPLCITVTPLSPLTGKLT